MKSLQQHMRAADRMCAISTMKSAFLLFHNYRVFREDHRLYVPQCALQHELLQQAHDGPMAGHLGRDKMFSRLSDNFYWPRMKVQVQDYCRPCPVCQAAKSTSQKQLGP
eukprot:363418-Chlamydomonas_euryale.AAC.11